MSVYSFTNVIDYLNLLMHMYKTQVNIIMRNIIFITFIAVSLSSCISTSSISISNMNKTGDVQLYILGNKPDAAYQEIALVSVEGANTEKLLDAFRAEVKKDNGDAAINIFSFLYGNETTLSGVAIRFTK